MTPPQLTSNMGTALITLILALLTAVTSVSATSSPDLTASTNPGSNFTVPTHSLAFIPCETGGNGPPAFDAHCYCCK